MLLGIAALGTSATAFLYYQHAHLPPPPPPPPSPPPAAPPPHGMRSVDPTRVELFCGKEFCAYTWQGRPGVIAVTTAGGEETEKNLFHTCERVSATRRSCAARFPVGPPRLLSHFPVAFPPSWCRLPPPPNQVRRHARGHLPAPLPQADGRAHLPQLPARQRPPSWAWRRRLPPPPPRQVPGRPIPRRRGPLRGHALHRADLRASGRRPHDPLRGRQGGGLHRYRRRHLAGFCAVPARPTQPRSAARDSPGSELLRGPPRCSTTRMPGSSPCPC